LNILVGSAFSQKGADLVNDFLHENKTRLQHKKIKKILRSGVSFEELYTQLQTGKKYSSEVDKGMLTWEYQLDSITYVASVFVPKSYVPDKKYRLNVMLHGGVRRGDKYSVAVNFRRKPLNCESLESIVLYPASWKERPWWHLDQQKNIQHLVRQLKQLYNIDENNIHFSGLSDGATGVFYHTNLNKTLWATTKAYIGSLGAAVWLANRPIYKTNYSNCNIWALNTGKDANFPLFAAKLYMDLLREVSPELKYHILPEYGHVMKWYPSYKKRIQDYEIAHPRNPFPDSLVWQTDHAPKFGRLYWLNIDRIKLFQKKPLGGQVRLLTADSLRKKLEIKPSGIVRLKASGNQIYVNTQEVKQLSLLLSPKQFDFGKEFEIILNGKLYFKGRLEKDSQTMLKWYVNDLDRTMLFANEFRIKIK